MHRHELDLTALVSGALFVALGLAFLSDRTGIIDLQVRWIWPALLVGLGIALLVPSRSNGAQDR